MAERGPEKRWGHESALIDGRLYLFGGRAGLNFFGRDEIWVMDLRVAAPRRKWLCRLARTRTIPQACEGARCVVIDEMIYSYGGSNEEWDCLGVVHRLDPRNGEWVEVATPLGSQPVPRAYCCLCAVGSRMIMFGGESDAIPPNQLQTGATQEDDWNNEIYEFLFEEGREKGKWLDFSLHGTRPNPFQEASMATIDEHRAFLLGIDIQEQNHVLLLNLQIRCWTFIVFDVNPSPRLGHTICQLVTEGLEEKPVCLLIGGENISSFDSVYVLDIDDVRAYKIVVGQQFKNVYRHTSHCLQNDDETTSIVIYDEGLKFLHLDSRNESYMKIERIIIQRELQRLRRQCTRLEKEVECSAEENRRCEEQAAQMREEFDRKQRRLEEENTSIRRQLEQHTRDLVSATEAQRQLREEKADALRRCETLQASRKEMENRQDKFLDVLSIDPDELHVTEQNLGSGAFAGVCIGLWRGTRVAVKKFHEVLAMWPYSDAKFSCPVNSTTPTS